MKKILITMLITGLVLNLGVVGCSKTTNNDNKDSSKAPQNEVIADNSENDKNDAEDNNTDTEDNTPTEEPNKAEDTLLAEGLDTETEYNPHTNEYMYELYASNLEAFKGILDKKGIEYEERKGDSKTNYNDTVLIQYGTSDRNSEYSHIAYEIASNDDGDIMFISVIVSFYTDTDTFKNKEFKFEDNIMSEIHQLICPGENIADEVNQKINAKYKKSENIEDKIYFGSGKDTGTIALSKDIVTYSINIHP